MIVNLQWRPQWLPVFLQITKIFVKLLFPDISLYPLSTSVWYTLSTAAGPFPGKIYPLQFIKLKIKFSITNLDKQ